VAVKIRLLRMGKIRNPQYRIVVADARTKRDGRAIEYVGIYHPKENPSLIEVKSDRVQYWLSAGDWQKFKGLPAPPPLLVAPEKASRQATYEAEAKAAAGVADTPAKAAKKATRPPAESSKAEPTKGQPGKAEPTKAEPATAEPTKVAAAPEAAEAKPAQTKPADPAEPNREAVAETAEDPAGAGADAS
jgi:small subunit ribosomal protein S16